MDIDTLPFEIREQVNTAIEPIALVAPSIRFTAINFSWRISQAGAGKSITTTQRYMKAEEARLKALLEKRAKRLVG